MSNANISGRFRCSKKVDKHWSKPKNRSKSLQTSCKLMIMLNFINFLKRFFSCWLSPRDYSPDHFVSKWMCLSEYGMLLKSKSKNSMAIGYSQIPLEMLKYQVKLKISVYFADEHNIRRGADLTWRFNSKSNGWKVFDEVLNQCCTHTRLRWHFLSDHDVSK